MNGTHDFFKKILSYFPVAALTNFSSPTVTKANSPAYSSASCAACDEVDQALEITGDTKETNKKGNDISLVMTG